MRTTFVLSIKHHSLNMYLVFLVDKCIQNLILKGKRNQNVHYNTSYFQVHKTSKLTEQNLPIMYAPINMEISHYITKVENLNNPYSLFSFSKRLQSCPTTPLYLQFFTNKYNNRVVWVSFNGICKSEKASHFVGVYVINEAFHGQTEKLA